MPFSSYLSEDALRYQNNANDLNANSNPVQEYGEVEIHGYNENCTDMTSNALNIEFAQQIQQKMRKLYDITDLTYRVPTRDNDGYIDPNAADVSIVLDTLSNNRTWDGVFKQCKKEFRDIDMYLIVKEDKVDLVKHPMIIIKNRYTDRYIVKQHSRLQYIVLGVCICITVVIVLLYPYIHKTLTMISNYGE